MASMASAVGGSAPDEDPSLRGAPPQATTVRARAAANNVRLMLTSAIHQENLAGRPQLPRPGVLTGKPSAATIQRRPTIEGKPPVNDARNPLFGTERLGFNLYSAGLVQRLADRATDHA